jgi:hypothetical protein
MRINIRTILPALAVMGVAGCSTAPAVRGDATKQTTPSSNVLVVVCDGAEYSDHGQTRTNFTWTYTIDLAAHRVDGFRASISDERITWQLKSATVLDEREISRYSKRFHFAGKDLSNGAEFYYGDGICEPQEKKAF